MPDSSPDPAGPAPKKFKRSGKPRKRKPKKRAEKKEYFYEDTEKGLPVFGVIVQWAKGTKLSNKAVLAKLEPKIAAFSNPVEEVKAPTKIKSLKRKKSPYFRRTAPHKGMVMFDNMQQANEFARSGDPDFTPFIPMSFVSTVGTVTIKAPIQNSQIPSLLPDGFKALQWRKKHVDNKTIISIAIRGLDLPALVNLENSAYDMKHFPRKPVYCTNCLRYGHRVGNCLHKNRCGVCIEKNPYANHSEKNCPYIKQKIENIERCLFCRQNHCIGTPKCIEQQEQCKYKMKLSKKRMDYLSVLQADILPSVRATPIESDRTWLNQVVEPKPQQ